MKVLQHSGIYLIIYLLFIRSALILLLIYWYYLLYNVDMNSLRLIDVPVLQSKFNEEMYGRWGQIGGAVQPANHVNQMQ